MRRLQRIFRLLTNRVYFHNSLNLEIRVNRYMILLKYYLVYDEMAKDYNSGMIGIGTEYFVHV